MMVSLIRSGRMLARRTFQRAGADHNTLIRNAGWLLSVEMLAKVSRILTILALAATLTAVEYGTVMLALACSEVLRLLMRSGTGAQIVQCSESELPRMVGNGLILQWLVCVLLATLQAVLAYPIGAFYGNDNVSLLLLLMAPTYLLFPVVSTRVFLMQRANQMRQFSVRNGACILMENLAIAVAALAGAGIFAIIAGKVVFALVWVAGFWRVKLPVFSMRFDRGTFLSLVKSSSQLTGTELSRAARMHLDILIAGRLLTPELFGLYSFAKSAGVGLTQSVSQAFVSALYPYLCEQHRQRSQVSTAMIVGIVALIAIAFGVQSAAVPVYVPMLFGERWDESLHTTAILCLLAVPALLIDARCTALRARAKYSSEMHVRLYCLLISALLLWLAQPHTPVQFAITYLATSACWMLCFVPRRWLGRNTGDPTQTFSSP